jgi:hypothetical protein
MLCLVCVKCTSMVVNFLNLINMVWYDVIWYMIWYDIWYYMIWYDIYLLTAIGLPPSGSSTVHIYTPTIHRTRQLITHRTTQLTTSWEECGPCPVFASYTLAFALQLRKKHGKTSVRVAEECQLAWWKQNTQNRTYVTIRIHKPNNRNT